MRAQQSIFRTQHVRVSQGSRYTASGRGRNHVLFCYGEGLGGRGGGGGWEVGMAGWFFVAREESGPRGKVTVGVTPGGVY